MSVHHIRLKGPWELHSSGIADAASEEVSRCQLPFSFNRVAGNEANPRKMLSRSFHRPTGLEPSTEVWIVLFWQGDFVSGVDFAQVEMNGQVLSPEPSRIDADFETRRRSSLEQRYPVRSIVKHFNRLTVRVLANQSEAVLHLAALEISESDQGTRRTRG